MKISLCICLTALILSLTACDNTTKEAQVAPIVVSQGGYPFITEYKGTFYHTLQAPPPNSIVLRASQQIDSIAAGVSKMVWDGNAHGMMNIWSPELARINDKWYVYFEADDGNTDNHQIYVLENANVDPMQGEWTLRGPIVTDSEWNFGIHPSTIVVRGRQYLFWSGWQHRRAETETQCIFIAEMENPWTLKSGRVLISKPEYVWERQWINPDGSRSAYPIFVNENPEPFLSPDGEKIVVGYSASGIWTQYNTLGVLYASTDSDLLDPKSWTKLPEPQFLPDTEGGLFGASNISVVNSSTSNTTYMMYQAKEMDNGLSRSNIYIKTITWDVVSLPVFGTLQ